MTKKKQLQSVWNICHYIIQQTHCSTTIKLRVQKYHRLIQDDGVATLHANLAMKRVAILRHTLQVPGSIFGPDTH
jgi:hypothetical protein